MKYTYFIIFVASVFFSINSFGANTITKYKRVIDTQTGALDNEFCSRDCPKFPGGEEALVKYIYTQLGLPTNLSETKQNPTIVKFLIMGNGKVRDVSIEKTSNEQYDKEILKIVSSLPNFTPSKDLNTCYYGWITIYTPKAN